MFSNLQRIRVRKSMRVYCNKDDRREKIFGIRRYDSDHPPGRYMRLVGPDIERQLSLVIERKKIR